MQQVVSRSTYEAVANDKDDTSSTAAPGAKPPTRLWLMLQLVGTCSVFLCCSSGIIVVNRVIMRELGFGYPMALSAWGQGVSFLVAWVVCDGVKLAPAPVGMEWRYILTVIVPMGAAQGVAIWLSNKLYTLLTVAFIEMARAMLPLITLAALWLASLETPTLEHIKAVSLTGVGCAISAYGEVALSTLGLICVALNFAIEAGRMVMMQFLVQGRDIHPWQTLKLMTLPATLMLLAMSAALELQDMRRQGAGRIILEQWPFFAAAGTLGLAVNILANVIIKLSSATTVKLLGAVRGPMLVLTGVLLFAETVTPLQFVGYSLALAGFVWYNLAKARTGGGAKGSNPGKV